MRRSDAVPGKKSGHALFHRSRRHLSLEDEEPKRPNISLDLDYLEYDGDESSNEVPTLHSKRAAHNPISRLG